MRTEGITYERYFDKVYGGWIGKCLGGAAGAPVEGYKCLIECKDYKEMLRTDLPNDDLDLQLLWLEVLQKKGFDLTSEDLAMAWDKQCWYPFSEYGIFLKNYERGICPPTSGSFNNPLFCEGEGSPIRSEIWGMCFPGRPEIAAKYAKLDSSLDHYGESVWIEQFYAAMESQAFFETDILQLIQKEIHWLPKNSRARKCVEEVLTYYVKGNDDWQCARKHMLRRYGHHEFTNAVTNLGIVIIALLYGEHNLDKIINIAFRSGFDADCTCATAAAIFGIMIGREGIDKKLQEIIGDTLVVGIEIESSYRSIKQLTVETCEMGCLAEKAGGISITNIPENMELRTLPKKESSVLINVRYNTMPAIGYCDDCEVIIEITNEKECTVEGILEFEKVPFGWKIEYQKEKIKVCPGEHVEIPVHIQTDENVTEVHNTNKIIVNYAGLKKEFGIAGACIWKVMGPFTEALEKEDRKGIPSPHGEGCNLPTLECMVNNAVFLEKKYVDESNFIQVFADDPVIINEYEDLMKLDEKFTYKGQGCIYLNQTIISPDDREVWFVIGNNDGFKIWINDEMVFSRDEIRLWTPYNNYEIVRLKKGVNEIVLKLLRRTELLKFSFGVRKYEGEHFHKKRWCVDFVSKL